MIVEHSAVEKADIRRMDLTVLALACLGHLASSDGGETLMLRRAA
jgi:hypothetical protein